ncbi:MAG: hypothetical protein AB7K24_10790 [Gemmataceae bacterium]
MPFPFDATLKELVRNHPADFEAAFGLKGPGPAVAVNVDLSTISAATDVVLAYGEPPTALVDLNFQASRDSELVSRLLLYNALLHHRYQVPVHSLVVLLREVANSSDLTGKYHYRVQGKGKVQFDYEVVRLWLQPVRKFLKAGPGVLPLAVLARLPARAPQEVELSHVVQKMGARFARETAPAEAGRLLTSAFILTGLRLPREGAVELFKGAIAMEESTTYQYILEKGLQQGLQQGVQQGKVAEARNILLRLGTKFIGEPDRAATNRLEQIEDLERLELLLERVDRAASWQELLASPPES